MKIRRLGDFELLAEGHQMFNFPCFRSQNDTFYQQTLGQSNRRDFYGQSPGWSDFSHARRPRIEVELEKSLKLQIATFFLHFIIVG